MIFFILKLILLLVLTAIPILFGTLVKPRQETSERCRNMYSFIGSCMPWIKKVCGKTARRILALWYKMKRTENGRKFFTCIVIVIMLAIQFVDFRSTGEVASKCKTAYVTHNEKSLMTINPSDHPKVMEWEKALVNYWYPYLTPSLAYLVAMFVTVVLFSDKIASKVLGGIYKNKKLWMLMAILVIALSYIDEGRYMLLAEMAYILMAAGFVYPVKTKRGFFGGGRSVNMDTARNNKEAA